MDPARLFRFRRAHLRAGDASLLRAGTALGERRTGGTVVLHRLRDLADALLAVLLAPTCLHCEQPLDAPLTGPMCAACWQAVPLLLGPLCECCSEPVVSHRLDELAHLDKVPSPLVAGGASNPATPAALLCPRCRQQRPLVSIAAAAGRYDGSLRAAIHGLKYDQRRSLARPLARLMATYGSRALSGADAVVPVPLHPSRRRQRGFNQAADLARRLGLPMIHALRRVRATAPQADLAADDRLANVAAAFAAARSPQRWRDATLVLVDDVATTGATLDACAAVLLRAGAKEVRALTAARAVKSRP